MIDCIISLRMVWQLILDHSPLFPEICHGSDLQVPLSQPCHSRRSPRVRNPLCQRGSSAARGGFWNDTLASLRSALSQRKLTLQSGVKSGLKCGTTTHWRIAQVVFFAKFTQRIGQLVALTASVDLCIQNVNAAVATAGHHQIATTRGVH